MDIYDTVVNDVINCYYKKLVQLATPDGYELDYLILN